MRIIILIVCSVMVITACKKKKEKNASTSTELIIKPNNLNCGNDQVRVRLYESEVDFYNLETPIREELTVGGKVHFKDLEQKIYYFNCKKVCGSYAVSNMYCGSSSKVYKTNGSLSTSQVQEIEVLMCI